MACRLFPSSGGFHLEDPLWVTAATELEGGKHGEEGGGERWSEGKRREVDEVEAGGQDSGCKGTGERGEPLTCARGGREERRRRGGSRESEQPGEGAARGAGVPTPWNSLSTWS